MQQTSIKKRVIGVDIGNALTTYAIVDVRGNVIAIDSFPTSDYPDVSHYIERLTESIITIAEANGGYDTIRSVGISCPSASRSSGCIENAANLPWKGVVPLAAMLTDRLGLAVAVSNDAAHELLAESDAPSRMRDMEQLTPRAISALCDEGDELAIEVFRRTGYLFGIGLATYASLINPEAIIVTGGISHAGRWLMEPTRESFENHVFRNMRGKVRIIQSDLNDAERDVLGASALAWEVPEYSLFK